VLRVSDFELRILLTSVVTAPSHPLLASGINVPVFRLLWLIVTIGIFIKKASFNGGVNNKMEICCETV
jgi:hypothetical protein